MNTSLVKLRYQQLDLFNSDAPTSAHKVHVHAVFQLHVQLANLFLFHYEYAYMRDLIRDNLCMAKRFSHTVRYIDDLLTLNNTMFEGEICNIYPPELPLNETTECEATLSYFGYFD